MDLIPNPPYPNILKTSCKLFLSIKTLNKINLNVSQLEALQI